MTRKIGGSAVHLWGRVGECMHGSGVGVVGVNGYKLKQGGSTPTHLANNLSTGPHFYSVLKLSTNHCKFISLPMKSDWVEIAILL